MSSSLESTMKRYLVGSLGLLVVLGGCDEDKQRSPAAELVDTDGGEGDGDEGDDDDAEDPGADAGDDTAGPGGSSDDSGSSETGSEPRDTDDGSPSGDTDGGDDSSGPNPQDIQCETTSTNLTSSGFASASSVYDSWLGPAYEASLAVDGDLGTSWFSEGPEVDGDTSTFEWYVMRDHCIDQITLHGNGMHEEPDFQEMFGFGSVTISLYDTSGDVVLSREYELDGTPDPTITLDAEGVAAHRVVLELHDHEAPDCGGFGELEVMGRAEKAS